MTRIRIEDVLEYHSHGRPGKIEVVPTKKVDTQRDLSLAYTPGVARVVEEIERDPETAFDYTARGNLVAVVTNGTAILGLGDRSPLAAKPVMEGGRPRIVISEAYIGRLPAPAEAVARMQAEMDRGIEKALGDARNAKITGISVRRGQVLIDGILTGPGQ